MVRSAIVLDLNGGEAGIGEMGGKSKVYIIHAQHEPLKTDDICAEKNSVRSTNY